MDFEQALEVANTAMFALSGRHLNNVETAILIGAWQSKTYEQIASASGYSISYLTRDVGPKLWKLLSQALGETVSKTNFQAALERHWRSSIREDEQPKSLGDTSLVLSEDFLEFLVAQYRLIPCFTLSVLLLKNAPMHKSANLGV